MTQFFILRVVEKEGEKEAEDWTDAGMSINPFLLKMRGSYLSEKGRITRWKVEPVNSDEVKQMTRDDCVKYIVQQGYPVPPKSGCFYCPFQRLDQWKNLRFNHPNLWQRAVELEKNGSNYPDMTLSNFRKKGKPLTLEEVDKNLGKSLYDYQIDPAEEECSGACMT